jgi:phosphopantothenoylcysteine decarboxylase/phosphopantothenate--cysteine ligase
MHPSKELCCVKSEKLKGKKIVLAVTGSIAAVETVKLCRELIRNGAEIVPVMSGAAQDIIHPYSLEFATGKAPITEITGGVEHVAYCGEVPDRADLLLIAPSTANTISKIACGIDDSPVTTFATTAIGSKIPVMIVPAMHISMYNHPVVIENIEKLKSIGIQFVQPKIEEHKAKIPSTYEIVSSVIRTIGKRDLDEKKILIIGGSTEEPIDEMRIITNRGTGRTGVELSLNAFERGADVDLWMGGCNAAIPSFIDSERFNSVDDLVGRIGEINHDIVIMPAAISDYFVEKNDGKIPSNLQDLTLKLSPNPKVIKNIRESKNCFLVGFKAEAGLSKDELVDRAHSRLQELNLDLIIANDLNDVTLDTNSVYIIDNKKNVEAVSGSKCLISEKILDKVVSLC